MMPVSVKSMTPSLLIFNTDAMATDRSGRDDERKTEKKKSNISTMPLRSLCRELCAGHDSLPWGYVCVDFVKRSLFI
ncbi:hypothetical protein Trydic_g19997 [Trypoxylus dichotomus]